MGSVSYEKEFFSPLSAIEDRHFWFRARNRTIATLLEQLVRELPSGYRILEVGCGTGNVLGALARVATRGQVIGMDLFVEGLRFARRRTRVPVVQGLLEAAPFKTPFHIVGAFDAIEHLPDLDVLRCLYEILLPDGRVLVTVPALAVELFRRGIAPSAAVRRRRARRKIGGGTIHRRVLLTIHDYPLSARSGKATARFRGASGSGSVPGTRAGRTGGHPRTERPAGASTDAGSSMDRPPQAPADRHFSDRHWSKVTVMERSIETRVDFSLL